VTALALCSCGHVAAIHGPDGCVAATGCDCTTPARTDDAEVIP
jgi:hypothetical protein